MISSPKSRFKLKNESFEIPRNSAYSNLDTIKGQKNIEIPLFDDHWFKAHNSLPPHARDLRVLNDQTPSQRVFHVREYFKERDGQPSALPLLH